MTVLFKSGSKLAFKGLLAIATVASFMIIKSSAQLPALTAAPVTLAWDASPNPTVTGYKVCYGLANQLLPITNRVDVGRNLTKTLSGLTANSKYFFFVVAYDNTGYESPPSNVVNFTPTVVSKLGLTKQSNGSMQIKFRAGLGALCLVQYTSSLSSPNWQTLTTVTADLLTGDATVTDPLTGKPPMRFYRVKQL